MNKKSRLSAADILCILLMALPILAAIVIKVLTTPQSEGIDITGARIFFTVPMPLQDLIITEAQVNSWLVMLTVLGFCLFLTRDLRTRDPSARQHLAEWIVEKVEGLVKDSMDPYFSNFGAFICSILALSAFSSLLSLFGLFPPTSDLNVVAGWALLVFLLITYYKCKAGPLTYLKSFASPPALAPLNVISEVATPVSMAFRHYGNVLSGSVISALVAAGLGGLSRTLLSWLPGALGNFPLLRIGLPAVLSIYFDVFSGCLQAFIFAMLTMMYVSGGFPADEYEKRQQKKKLKKLEVH